MNKKSVVVFDFDGVLTVGGEGLKKRAWDMLACPWESSLKKALYRSIGDWSDGNGSRQNIIHQALGYLDASGEKLLVEAYADCYNTIVQKLLEQSGMPEGTEQTLAQLAEKHMLFVNSATPEKAVRELVQNFNIAHRFRGIFGQPISKVDNLARAQHIAHVDHEYMLFVGDSECDLKAAKEFGCAFVGVANEWNKWRTKHDESRPSVLIDSIAELPALLENENIPPTPLERGRHFFLP